MFAKKSLGQNFLRCNEVRRLMVSKVKEAAENLDKKPILIEIGPGRGYLTRSIAKIKDSFEKVILVEKDDILAEKLKNKPELEGIEVVNMDFLDYKVSDFGDHPFLVIGSLPYNVSKHIIHSLITSEKAPEYCVFLLQKEVAQDYAAESPDMKYLGSYSKLYAPSKVLKIVAPKCFNPQPKVYSAVIEFRKTDLKISDEIRKSVQRVMKLGFTQPRKTLYNNLKSLYAAENLKDTIIKLFKNEKARAQELTIPNWIEITKALESSKITKVEPSTKNS